MRLRLEPAPPRHVLTVHAALVDAAPERAHRLQLLTDQSVDVLLDAITETFGLPADPAPRLITPTLRQYGRPELKAELGFGRRTLDASKQPLFDALSEVGALARIHHGDTVIDIVVESIATPDAAADYPSVVATIEDEDRDEDQDQDGSVADDRRSSTTTDLGPTG